MTKKYNHTDIENAIQALKNPYAEASKYFVEQAENRDERNLYNELRVYKEVLLLLYEKKNLPDVSRQWEQLDRKISGHKRFFSRWKYAAAIIILFASAFLLWREVGIITLNNESQGIAIGSPKAILITEKGKQIRLEENKKSEIILQNNQLLVSKSKNTIKYDFKEKSLATDDEELSYHTVVVPRFGEWKLELPDGTNVWLNADSKLRYPVRFLGQERRVFLIGEAYFEVAHDSLNPFIVNTEKVNTRVLGTSFNISAYPEEDLNITLVDGKVQLHNKLKHRSHMLNPDDNAEMKVGESALTISKVDAKKIIAWKNGFYYFERVELNDILTKLQKWYDFQVFYENPGTKYYEFRMRADRNLPFERIVKRLEETGRINIEIVENSIIISDVKRQ